jgi:hypothetical protein
LPTPTPPRPSPAPVLDFQAPPPIPWPVVPPDGVLELKLRAIDPDGGPISYTLGWWRLAATPGSSCDLLVSSSVDSDGTFHIFAQGALTTGPCVLFTTATETHGQWIRINYTVDSVAH